MHKKPFLFVSALLSVAVLCVTLVWMIADRAAVLRDGREIVLKTEPIDPRDLLRGRYVRLNYAISRVPPLLFKNDEIDYFDSGSTVFVRVEEGDDGFWQAVEAAVGAIPDGADADSVWIRGETRYRIASTDVPAGVLYGIERFYAPEPVAPQIEQRMRDGDVTEVVVAVAGDGRAQIKALRQAGNTIFTERLW